MPTSNERKMLSSNEALKELRCTNIVTSAARVIIHLWFSFTFIDFHSHMIFRKLIPLPPPLQTNTTHGFNVKQC